MTDDEIENQAESSDENESDDPSAPGPDTVVGDGEEGLPKQHHENGSEESRALEAAFQVGNFGEVRRLSDELLSRPDLPAEIIEIAKDYRRRVGVDPVQLLILAGSLIFFAVVVYIYVL